MAANNYVFEQIKTRMGVQITLKLDNDATSYHGTLISAHSAGTDTADNGVSATANDDILIMLHLNRTKS